ncbi:ArsR/SmtB family transcription factor [Brucella pseudogrignonensis]|uniref:ArsR/SmtB family transcription factor n=1 Tax=Brucella pseudogrignonensis TaxID=419475 RepID=UPI0038D15AE1
MNLKSLIADPKTLNEISGALHGLANARRLSIMAHLQDCEMCVGDLANELRMSPSALSQHLAKLKEAGLVKSRQHRQQRYYSLSDANIIGLSMKIVTDLLNDRTVTITENSGSS